MNKKIVFMSLALAVAMPATTTFAADSAVTTTTEATVQSTTTTQRDMNRQNIEQNRTLRQDNLAEKQQNQDLRAQNQDARKQNMDDRCKNTEAKVGERIAKFQENKTNFTNAFQNMQARLQRLVDRLSTTQGVDLTKLKSDITILNTKIADAKTAQEAFMSTMQDVATAAPQSCGTSKGEFMGKLGRARTLALNAQKSRLDIRNFFETTIKADLLAIRKQVEAQKEVGTPTSTTKSAE